jgi:hypothetical protein
MQVTIAKNRTAPIIAKIASAKSYTLDNCFTGKPVEELDWLKSYLTKMQPKIYFDKATGTGQAYLHSNAYYNFEVAA